MASYIRFFAKRKAIAEPDPDPITACYKCGTTYLNPQSLTQHIKRCRGTSANLQSNALTFTQREMQLATSAKEGPYSLQNNTYVGEAYQQQLCMPPSLAEMARLHRIEQERTDNEQRSDDVEFDAPFDTMCIDESRDDDLPVNTRTR